MSGNMRAKTPELAGCYNRRGLANTPLKSSWGDLLD